MPQRDPIVPGHLKVADRLRALRAGMGLSMRQVAEHLGISSSAVGRIERGETPLALQHFEPLVELYSLLPDERYQLLEQIFATWPTYGIRDRDWPGATMAYRVLAARMQEIRKRAGRRKDVAALLGVDETTLRSLELASVPLNPRRYWDLLRICHVEGPERAEILNQALVAAQPGWWKSYPLLPVEQEALSIESAASRICVYSPDYIPGLAATIPYARAVAHARSTGSLSQEEEARLERYLELLAERQRRLRESGTKLWFLLKEEAFLAQAGDKKIMEEQYEKLLAMQQEDSNVTIHFISGHTVDSLTGTPAFTLVRTPLKDVADRLLLWQRATGVQVVNDWSTVNQYKKCWDSGVARSEPKDTPLPIPALKQDFRQQTFHAQYANR